MKRTKQEKGITLVALIITIIVLLILAVVTIRAVQGDEIIRYAQNASDKYTEKTNEEQGILKDYEDRITTEVTGVNPKLNPSGKIPEGATYTIKELKRCDSCFHTFGSTPSTCMCGSYVDAVAREGRVLNSGDEFLTIADGDIYTYGDYLYRYYTVRKGWQVSLNYEVTDRTETKYGAILESINNLPVTDMRYTFEGCDNLTIAPVIPSSVENIERTFQNCKALKTYIGSTDRDGDFSKYVIPNGVTSMYQTFLNCDSLTAAPNLSNCTKLKEMNFTFKSCAALTDVSKLVIPSSVTEMYSTFAECDSLTDVSKLVIPSSVKDMRYTFEKCSKLTGSITVNSTPTDYTGFLKRNRYNRNFRRLSK